jgi:hypothetical protein
MARSILAALGLLALAVASPAVADDQGRSVAGATDKSWVHAPRPAGELHVVVKTFGTDNADRGTGEKGRERAAEIAETMEAGAPSMLLASLTTRLRDNGAFVSVTSEGSGTAPEGALVVEGEFTVINPGSRAKRYFVGMGAGKAKICVKGRIATADGQTLASFDHCRVGTGGWYGGRSEGMMAVDVSQTGLKVAEFLTDWARGRYDAAK